MIDSIKRVGAQTLDTLAFIHDLAVLAYGALKSPFLTRTRGFRIVYEIFLAQVRFTGAQAVSLVAFAALAIGALIQIELITFVPSADAVAHIVAHITVKDVAPILAAVIIIGRSGTAIAVELANMKLSGELDALAGAGLALEHVIVLPRLMGAVVSFLGILIVAQASALVGGYLIAAAVLRPPFTLNTLIESVLVGDLLVSLGKGAILGALISVTCVREGISVKVDQREVPQAATRAVVRSMTLSLVLNTFISIYS